MGQIIDIAHRLKGAARMVEENGLADLAQRMEASAQLKQTRQVAELLGQLQQRADAVSAEIGVWLDEQAA